jgi:hypothetical protein
MSSIDGFTTWIGELQQGKPEAAQRLWQSYFERLTRLARLKMAHAPRRVADEEDLALAALDSFCRGAQQGRFPKLEDRDDLWQVLVMLTARKVLDQRDHDRRLKRGGGNVRGESAFGNEELGPRGLEQVIGTEPTPALVVEFAEEFDRLLAALDDPDLRRIAIGKLEGLTNAELAAQRQCGLRSIERKLAIIRRTWQSGPE